MGLTYEECLRCSPSLAALHPDAPGAREPSKVPGAASTRRSKYGATSTMHAGVRYASKAEAIHAERLDHETASGQISWWIGQPRFRLGVAENVYVADFLVVSTDGSIAAHEVKGARTPKFEHDVKLWHRFGPCALVIFHRGRTQEVIVPQSVAAAPSRP